LKNRIAGQVTFSEKGNAVTSDETGWFIPEPEFTWALRSESTIQLPEGDYTRPAVLTVRAAPFVCGDVPFQRMSFVIGGQRFGEAEWRFECSMAFPMPTTTDPRPVLTISHPDAAHPQPGDARRLAFAFRRIQILQLDAPLDLETRLFPAPSFISANEPAEILKAVEAETGMPSHEVLTSFESIGDDCEFGFVQRNLQAEPLGLLRFSSSYLDAVIEGMDSEFQGIIEGMDPRPDPGCSDEWIVHIERYGMHYHTFLYKDQIDFDAVVQRETTKTRFLVGKLIQDLGDGHKIFVLKNFHRPLSRAEALAAFLAIRRRGEGRLLWVTPAPADIPAGSIDVVAPGFWHGYIDRFALDHDMNHVSLRGWATLLVNAVKLCRQVAPQLQPRPGEHGPGAEVRPPGSVAGSTTALSLVASLSKKMSSYVRSRVGKSR